MRILGIELRTYNRGLYKMSQASDQLKAAIDRSVVSEEALIASHQTLTQANRDIAAQLAMDLAAVVQDTA